MIMITVIVTRSRKDHWICPRNSHWNLYSLFTMLKLFFLKWVFWQTGILTTSIYVTMCLPLQLCDPVGLHGYSFSLVEI